MPTDSPLRLRRSPAVGAVLVALFVVTLAGCGGDSSPTAAPTPTPSPQELVRGIIAQTSFAGFATDIWVQIPIALSGRGRLDITVNWTSPDTGCTCTSATSRCNYTQLSRGTCPFLIRSETRDPKPRVLFTHILDPGTYYLVLYNVPRDPRRGIGSDNTEAVSVQSV
jgi:hypothetical protein